MKNRFLPISESVQQGLEPEPKITDFTISKAALSITANNHEIFYGDEPANNGVADSGFVLDEDEMDIENN